MARLIPDSLPEGAPVSERKVFESFIQLGDSWTVLWNVPVGLFGKPTATLRQIDFLLLHEHHGIIVVEVKGGAIKTERGQWWTQPRGSTGWKKLQRSPFEQAADQRFALQRYLAKEFKCDRVLSHAVAFPATIVGGDLGPDAPRGAILDVEGLKHPASALKRVRETWGESPALPSETIERIVNRLRPTFTMTVVSAVAAADTLHALERETRRQAAMVQSQVDAYKTLLSANRVVVLGGAGTGKTVIAGQLAEQLTSTGNRTLLLCHRAAVQAFLHTLLGVPQTRRTFDPNSDELLHVTSWSGLSRAIAGLIGESQFSSGSPRVADQLIEYRDQGGKLFDAIVIDEGQEFTKSQVEALEWLLNEPGEGPMYLFADPFQHSGLFTGTKGKSKIRYRWRPPLDAQVVALTTNCRNSTPIAEVAARFYPYDVPTAVVDGPPPIYHQVPPDRVVTETISVTRHLIDQEGFHRNQILLIPIAIPLRSLEKTADRSGLHLAAVNQVFRYPLTPKDLRVPCGAPDDVQGLEADVAILAYLHTEESAGTDREIYIAMSRARSLMHVVSNLSEQEILELAARYAEQARAAMPIVEEGEDEHG